MLSSVYQHYLMERLDKEFVPLFDSKVLSLLFKLSKTFWGSTRNGRFSKGKNHRLKTTTVDRYSPPVPEAPPSFSLNDRFQIPNI